MLPETLQALAVVVLGLLPGALYVWSYERQTGLWGINLPDRLLRFLGVSALLHVIAAPLTYWLWHSWIRNDEWLSGGHLPWGLYGGVLAYVAAPLILGTGVGRTSGRIVRMLFGDKTFPRSWDYFFSLRPDGWIRIKLKDGPWIGGAYSAGSYASGYPEPQDLYLVDAAEVDPETGAFVLDSEGDVRLRHSALLITSEAIEYLEFNDA